MSDIELGKRIKERREHLKLSQEQLAKKMGYKDKSAISKIESGQRDLNQAKIQKFADVLLTTTSYLMGWVDDPRNYAEILDSYGKTIPDSFYPWLDDEERAREYLRSIQIEADLLKNYVNAIDDAPLSIIDKQYEVDGLSLYLAYKNADKHVRMAVCSLLGIDYIKINGE